MFMPNIFTHRQFNMNNDTSEKKIHAEKHGTARKVGILWINNNYLLRTHRGTNKNKNSNEKVVERKKIHLGKQ